jgi:SAM-dependent methyltransferase
MMKYTEQEIKKFLDDIISNIYKKNPILLSRQSESQEEQEYIDSLHAVYERILLDFNTIFPSDNNSKKVLEISSFLGIVDIALVKIGFDTYTYDIPEFQQNSNLERLYREFNIHSSSGFLKDIWKAGLPYPDNFFDAVILSEVLEHLNFNPLPLLQEINRIIKPGGIVYITTPNQVSLKNRLFMISGRSIRNPVSDSVAQLDRKNHIICGIHWREYSLDELTELMNITGFSLDGCRFSNRGETPESVSGILFSWTIDCISFVLPKFRNSITVIGKKENVIPNEFWFNDEYIKYYPVRKISKK